MTADIRECGDGEHADYGRVPGTKSEGSVHPLLGRLFLKVFPGLSHVFKENLGHPRIPTACKIVIETPCYLSKFCPDGSNDGTNLFRAHSLSLLPDL